MAAQPGNGNNPYVVIGGLTTLANILASDLSSQSGGQQLEALGMTNGFTASVPAFAAGPFISLTVIGQNSGAVRILCQ